MSVFGSPSFFGLVHTSVCLYIIFLGIEPLVAHAGLCSAEPEFFWKNILSVKIKNYKKMSQKYDFETC